MAVRAPPSYLVPQSTAMRAFVAILTIAVWPGCARDTTLHIPRLLTALKTSKPVTNLVSCGQTLGASKCFHALSSWRAENAANLLEKGSADFNITEDAEKFPWQKYVNVSNEEIYSNLCEGAEKLLHYRSLKLDLVPGYTFELRSKRNGTLNVEVYSNDSVSARGSMKKWRQQFYNIVPFLLVPGLIMSAILPFILPALKMMVMGVGMLNNMALSSAVFTLLRNNAFNDNYNHKIVYVNAGYRKKNKLIDEIQNDDDVNGATNDQVYLYPVAGEDLNNDEASSPWMDDYSNGNKFVNLVGYKNRRDGSGKRKKKNRSKNWF